MPGPFRRFVRCQECGREFDRLDPEESTEWEYGHDCEHDPGLTADRERLRRKEGEW